MAPKHKTSDTGNSNILLLYLVYKLKYTIGVYVSEET